MKQYSVSVTFDISILDDRLMDDNRFVEGIRENIKSAIKTRLEHQSGIGGVRDPKVDIWTERESRGL